jgi:hypothetical protein
MPLIVPAQAQTKPPVNIRGKSKKLIRRRYISPLEKQYGAVLNKDELAFFGRCIIKYIRQEALKDHAKTGQVPNSKDFLGSFSFQIKGNSIEVVSSWPWIDLVRFGTNGPYAMKWLTRAQGVPKVPLRGKHGEILIRNTPLTTDKAWIHPGIARHTFVERAFRRAKKDCFDKFLQRQIGNILNETLK